MAILIQAQIRLDQWEAPVSVPGCIRCQRAEMLMPLGLSSESKLAASDVTALRLVEMTPGLSRL